MATEAVQASNRTIARAAADAADRFADRMAVRWMQDGAQDGVWREHTFAEVSEIVDEISIEQLRARGRDGDRDELERRCDAVSPEDPYTIIYTSGTTGPPKGVVLSHGNCASVGVMVEEIGFINEDELSYLYLPLAHAFALTVQLASFDVGTAIVYFG